MIPISLKQELQQRIARAVTNREAAVDVMKELQRHYGWLNDEAVVEAAELLELTPLQVEELATFYEMIYRRPVGRHVVHVCDSISCWSMGGESLLQQFEKLLGIEAGGTTSDGIFTLLPCCCLGNCGNAPAVMVGERQFGPVSPASVPALLAELCNSPC
ncbi:MAG: NADH-quinone oxidoreductase subunit NuoE [Deltaproteobacteria bacterium]|nr:NADH-quinone oxidoreductase subunit NuoE [Deltaproteobacteria bacterium]